MPNWNIVEAICQIAESPRGDTPALIHGDTVVSYAELQRRASGIAAWLQQQNLPAGSHVGHYLRNSTAYMESFTAAGLLGYGHVNVNYRYLADELVDLCNSLDIRVLVYDTEFAERVAEIRDRLTETTVFIEVPAEITAGQPASAEDPANDFAVSLAELYDFNAADFARQTSSDDLVLITTGGTTGLPKGTQWRHEDLWMKMKVSTGNHLSPLELSDHPADMADHVANVVSLPVPQPFMSLSPLMHGAGLMMAMVMMAQGAALATMVGQRFDAEDTLEVIKARDVGGLVLVGDAFALPMNEVLERRADEQLLAPLKMFVSSGASLSDESKAALLKHNPGLIIFDTLGSTEASGYAISTPEAGVFTPLPTTRVLDENLQDVVPGSDTIGMAYSGGYMPIGYYKSPEKSAETFVEVEGVRYVRTGDRCTVRADGKLVLLGRDSTVINSGGEKVYTVEVERVLVDHPTISDALVVGLPHPRFGKQVVAVVQGPALSAENLDVAGIRAHCAEHLADYKVPRLVFAIDDLQRAPNGKPDYPLITRFAEAQVAGAA